MKTIEIDGKRYLWKEILQMRREQRKKQRQPHPTLFELREDHRPPSQETGNGRYTEPLLFPE